MATICEWTEEKSYGETTYRVEKVGEGAQEAIEVQVCHSNGWATLERYSKSRVMFAVLEKLGSEAQRLWLALESDWPSSI